MQTTPKTLTAIRYAITISLGGFVFGFDATVISGVVGFVSKEFDLGPEQIGLIFFWTGLAALLSSGTIGFIADIFGRKRALQFLAALYVVSAFFSAIAWDYQSLIIARAIGGYAFGSLVVAPVYIAEISPAAIRGRLGTVNQLNIVVGLAAAYFTNLFLLRLSEGGSELALFFNITPDNVWNFMLGLELLPAILWLLLISTIPRSPRWLAAQGKWEEAKSVLSRIVSAEEIDVSVSGIKDNLGGEKTSLIDQLRSIFTRKMAFILFVSVVIAITQMITGINVVFFYAATIFELSGVGQDAAFVQAISVGLTNVLFTLVAMALVDKLGRKPLMLAGLAGAAISLAIVSSGFKTATYAISEDAIANIAPLPDGSTLPDISGHIFDDDVSFKAAITKATSPKFMRDNEAEILKSAMNANSRLILFGILGFVASFAISMGPIMWVFLSEIFPVRIRGIAISLVTIFNSGTSTMVTTLFPIQVANSGIASVFVIFTVWAIAGFFLLAWLMPETKGLSLEDIEKKYVQGS